MWALKLFSRVDPKRVGLVVLIVVSIGLAALAKIQNDQLRLAKVVYGNPRVVERVRVVKIAGPVRIVTRIIERPTGEKETTVVSESGPVVESSGRESESTPVPLSIALAPPRTDRYLLGLGLDNWAPRDAHSYRVYAGYSFKNRLDVLYGLGYRDSLDQQVVAIVRF